MFGEQRVVWFNEGLENLYDIFQGLREADVSGKLRLLASARNVMYASTMVAPGGTATMGKRTKDCADPPPTALS